MDKIEILKYPQFPMSSETLALMQSMSFMLAKLASLGGVNYIVSGCEDDGGVNPGVVVINGEVLPFAGGARATYVIISETKSSVQVYGEVYSDLYINRTVVFGTANERWAWSEFKRVTDLCSLGEMVATLKTSFFSLFLSVEGIIANIEKKAYKSDEWYVVTAEEYKSGVDVALSKLRLRKNNNGSVSITGQFKMVGCISYIQIPSSYVANEPKNLMGIRLESTLNRPYYQFFKIGYIDADYFLVLDSTPQADGMIYIDNTYFID